MCGRRSRLPSAVSLSAPSRAAQYSRAVRHSITAGVCLLLPSSGRNISGRAMRHSITAGVCLLLPSSGRNISGRVLCYNVRTQNNGFLRIQGCSTSALLCRRFEYFWQLTVFCSSVRRALDSWTTVQGGKRTRVRVASVLTAPDLDVLRSAAASGLKAG